MVISGDIIWGAKLGQTRFDEDIGRQYEVAMEFLVQLTERLFAGDRTRVVLVPGNHDCCWNTAFSGMTPVQPGEEPRDVLAELEFPNSPFRWNWNERKLYKVSDPDRYSQRLDRYWEFVDQFYEGFDLKFPIQRETGYNLFELDDGRILVAAFASLHGNDCFSTQASFEPTAIPGAALRARDAGGYYDLRIAVWHHGVYSQPSYRSDYLAINSVYELIGHGFQLGLHGHQHFAEVGSHYVHVPGEHEMALVSAGSLCAGSKDLPRGVDRQYNVVVVSDDYSEALIHVREMTRGNHFAASSKVSSLDKGVVRMRLTRRDNSREGPLNPEKARRAALILSAEGELRSGRCEKALEILEDGGFETDAYGRSLLIQAAEDSEEWEKLVVVLADPRTADERIKLVAALAHTGRIEEAMTRLVEPSGPILAEHVQHEMKARLNRMAAMNEK